MIALVQFVAENAEIPVQDHYAAGTVELRTTFDVATQYLIAQTRQSWRRPSAAKLMKGGGYRDYFEIRFKAGRVEQRPIGFFYPDANTFVLLLWAIEKGQLLPKAWRKTADARRELIESGAVSPKLFERECDKDEDA